MYAWTLFLRLESHVPRACAAIQNSHVLREPERLHGQSAPATVNPSRNDAVQPVIGGRDAIKHLNNLRIRIGGDR